MPRPTIKGLQQALDHTTAMAHRRKMDDANRILALEKRINDGRTFGRAVGEDSLMAIRGMIEANAKLTMAYADLVAQAAKVL